MYQDLQTITLTIFIHFKRSANHLIPQLTILAYNHNDVENDLDGPGEKNQRHNNAREAEVKTYSGKISV